MNFWLGLGLGAVGGGAAVWFGKDQVLKLVLGAEAFAQRLRDRANAVAAAIRR